MSVRTKCTQTIRGSLSFGFLGVAYISNLFTQNLQNVIYLTAPPSNQCFRIKQQNALLALHAQNKTVFRVIERIAILYSHSLLILKPLYTVKCKMSCFSLHKP